MKNKKILAIILSFTMMIGSLPMSVFADESEETVSEDHQEVTEIQEDIPEEEPEIPEPEIVSTDEAALYDSGDAGSGYVVTTWAELKEALAAVPLNNENTLITLAADITAGSMIEIKPGMNVSLHLDGYTLSRDINSQDADGHVIIVKSGAVLDIYGSSAERGWGTITGGFANNGGGINNKGILDVAYVDIINNNAGDTAASDTTKGGGIWNSGELTLGACKISGNKADDGGGIYNAAGGTIILNDISITGNTSILHGGGGIVNYGTITFEASNTITGNTSKSNGGGVWNDGTFKLSGSDNKLVIKNNTSTSYPADNLFLNGSTKITFESDAGLNSDTEVFVSTVERSRAITSGWKYGADQNMIKAEADMSIGYSGGELMAEYTRTYIDRAWVNGSVQQTVKSIPDNAVSIQYLRAAGPHWADGTLLINGICVYVDDNTIIDARIQVRGNVSFILKDGVTFNCSRSIEVIGDDSILSIYGQTTDSGKIIATGDANMAGIGGHVGNENGVTGRIRIYGGTIKAYGGKEAAGIGTGKDNWCPEISIYGGTVTAEGGENASGIGVGYNGYVHEITIYGGDVTATGDVPGDEDKDMGAGIGGAGNATSSITIEGGTIHAYGRGGGAGIGTGYRGSYDSQDGPITINGGQVYAYGSCGNDTNGYDSGPCKIGGAGIGSGARTDSKGLIQINGGYVEAVSIDDYHSFKSGGAGIGAGYKEYGLNRVNRVEINGGEVKVMVRNAGSPAIGGTGESASVSFEELCGELVLYDNSMVLVNGVRQGSGNRVSGCRTMGSSDIVTVHIKPCDHNGISYTSDAQGHTGACSYCSTGFSKEAHRYNTKHKCTVCGYQGTLYDISFDGNGGSGSMDTVHVVPGSEYVLPGSSFTPPEDKVFTGWTVGSGTDMKAPGDKITVNSDTVLTANYEYFATLAGYTLSLDGDIGIKFYMRVADPGTDDPYMEFTVPGASEEYSTQKVYLSNAGTEVVDNVTYRVFTCHVAAKEMAQPIKAQMHWGDKTSGEYTYSVKQYAEFILANAGKSTAYANAVPLVKAMLNYGTEAQKHFNKSAPYANDTDYMSVDDKTVVPLGAADIDAKTAVIPDMQGVTFEGASLSLKSETTLSLYFKSSTTLEFSCTEKPDIKTAAAGGYQIVRIRGIKANELDELMTVMVTCGDQSYTIRYSALNYCKNALGGSHPELVNVVSALYKYWQEAEAYIPG